MSIWNRCRKSLLEKVASGTPLGHKLAPKSRLMASEGLEKATLGAPILIVFLYVFVIFSNLLSKGSPDPSKPPLGRPWGIIFHGFCDDLLNPFCRFANDLFDDITDDFCGRLVR